MTGFGGQSVALRPLYDSDLDALFRQMSDPESVRMAAFTPEDPKDRQRCNANHGSLRVLEKAGFQIIGTEVSFAPWRQEEIEETVLRLG